MTPRGFLVRGLVVGLVAGVLAFAVAFLAGEPHVERAIELEDSAAAVPAESAESADDGHTHSHDDESAGGHSHGDEGGTEVSRGLQRTAGLLTATLAIGVALGGLTALAAAAALGRLGRLRVVGSTATVAMVGFVAVALVPFLVYPPNPPAVGSGETIGTRTGAYFALLLASVALAVVAVVVAARTTPRMGGLPAVVGSALGYVVLMALLAAALPHVDELGDFPASTLWAFRLSSLATLATMWAAIGVGLAWSLTAAQRRADEAHARRELAASL